MWTRWTVFIFYLNKIIIILKRNCREIFAIVKSNGKLNKMQIRIVIYFKIIKDRNIRSIPMFVFSQSLSDHCCIPSVLNSSYTVY